MTLSQTIVKRLTSREPVSRYALRTYLANKGFAISDRAMRLEIVRLRKKGGHLITSSLSGYKMATTVKEFEQHLKFKESYAKAILSECKAMKKNLKRATRPQLF